MSKFSTITDTRPITKINCVSSVYLTIKNLEKIKLFIRVSKVWNTYKYIWQMLYVRDTVNKWYAISTLVQWKVPSITEENQQQPK